MKNRPMRIISYILIAVMLSQAVVIPAADPIPIDVDLVVKGPDGFDFNPEIVISDDGTAFYIRNGAVMLNEGVATGIAIGSEFFDKGTLARYRTPRLEYVDGAARSVLISATFGLEGTLSVVDFSGLPLTAGPGQTIEESDPRLILLLFLNAAASSLPSVATVPFFFPVFRAFFIDGFRDNPAFSALMVFSLWGAFGTTFADVVFSGRVGGTLIDPLVYSLGGLVLSLIALGNSFYSEQIRLRSNYIMTAIAASVFVNASLIPSAIAYIGFVTKILPDAAQVYRIERTLTAAVLFTYLFGFPGLTSRTKRYVLKDIFELRGAYRRLGLLAGIVELSGGDKQMVMWLALTSKKLELRASPQGAELDAEPRYDADFDDSGTVDEDDFDHLLEFYTGPSPGTALDPAGQDADFDQDGDIDQLDFNIFIGQYQTPEWEPPAPAPEGSGLEADPLPFDQEMHNTGLAIPVITEGDPVPGHPDLTVRGFVFTQAGGMGTALIGLVAADKDQNFVTLLIVVNNEGTFCAMRVGQDLGDGEIASINRVSNVNTVGQFLVKVSLISGEKAIYRFTPLGAVIDTAVGDAWIEY